jgi:Tol biopolymer transport system component
VVATINTVAQSQVWHLDVDRGTLALLSLEGFSNSPIWTPDGKRVTYQHIIAGGPRKLVWAPVDGSDRVERLTEGEYDEQVGSWSPDGEVLAFTEMHPVTGLDIWLLSVNGEDEARPYLQTEFDESQPMFSPDGRWLAYRSNESGRDEVYVQPYPGPGEKTLISTEGGRQPLWARDGKELFYLIPQEHTEIVQIIAVEVTTSGTNFMASKPRLLFEGPYLALSGSGGYDVTPDGRHFLMVQLEQPDRDVITEIHIVLNWFEELKQTAPAEVD